MASDGAGGTIFVMVALCMGLFAIAYQSGSLFYTALTPASKLELVVKQSVLEQTEALSDFFENYVNWQHENERAMKRGAPVVKPFKALLIGDSGTGKTLFVEQLQNNIGPTATVYAKSAAGLLGEDTSSIISDIEKCAANSGGCLVVIDNMELLPQVRRNDVTSGWFGFLRGPFSGYPIKGGSRDGVVKFGKTVFIFVVNLEGPVRSILAERNKFSGRTVTAQNYQQLRAAVNRDLAFTNLCERAFGTGGSELVKFFDAIPIFLQFDFQSMLIILRNSLKDHFDGYQERYPHMQGRPKFTPLVVEALAADHDVEYTSITDVNSGKTTNVSTYGAMPIGKFILVKVERCFHYCAANGGCAAPEPDPPMRTTADQEMRSGGGQQPQWRLGVVHFDMTTNRQAGGGSGGKFDVTCTWDRSTPNGASLSGYAVTSCYTNTHLDECGRHGARRKV